MESAEVTLVEIPVIITYVESCVLDEKGYWTKFNCLSDALLLGRKYAVGQRVQITIVEAGYEDYKRRIARQSKSSGG